MNKTLFGILTILFNAYGVPCFIQGQTKAGVIRIVLSCVTFGVMATINGIMGIIQGIKVLQMTEEEFQAQLGTIDMGIPKMIKEETAE
ncbi:MAG: hypothetical protein IKV01_04035 [Clostridia bacterium]|nr:hypothetical protein [Clostridia bacterium]